MKKRNLILLVFFFSISNFSIAQNRTEINIPDIPGYHTLKCDFHMHTVFSDGDVWPTVRVQEAWLQGLDVIAITDHIEYQPHSQDVETDKNRAYEIAKPLADQMGIILVPSAEITREMPPGHLNALFIKNANLLEREDWWEACVEAKEQGAFVFWNHPGWKAQQPDVTKWWDEHTRLLDEGIMQGIEVYNYKEFYPEALKWAKEKNLTVLANSDIHAPIGMVYNNERKRPITLVFVSERSENGVHQALLDRRSVAYYEGKLSGSRDFLTPLFFNSLEISNEPLGLANKEVKRIRIQNESELTYKLQQRQPPIGFKCPDEIILEANKTVLVELEGVSDELATMGMLKMYYEVENLNTLSGEALPVILEIINK